MEDLMVSQEIVEMGEIIHSIGNVISDGTGKIGTLSKDDGLLLQELGHALRVRRTDSILKEDFSALIESGFNPKEQSTITILGIAHRLIGNAGLVSFKEAVGLELGDIGFCAGSPPEYRVEGWRAHPIREVKDV
jgi:hypothetical protein